MAKKAKETNKSDVKEALDNAFSKFVCESLRKHYKMIKCKNYESK